MKAALIGHTYEGTKEKTILKTTQLISKASAKKAELVILSELHQNAYFCQRQNVQNFDLANDYLQDIQYWSNVAKQNNVVLVTSLFEKRGDGMYHNTAVVFEKDGTIAGKYRKMHIPDDPNFYEKFYFTQGDIGFEPINTSLGRLGVLICWDQWYPEAARIMCLKGAQILIYPTAIGWFDSDSDDEKLRQLNAWKAVQRGHAIANNLPVITVNRIGFESAKLSDENTFVNQNEGINFWGNSFVFGAQGQEIYCSDEKNEICQIVDIDLCECDKVRRWWPFLRDRRIDSYDDILKRFCIN